MTKLDVTNKIKKLASERNEHISFRAFIDETGIKEQWLRGQDWWRGWNNLLTEIGLNTRSFLTPEIPMARVAGAVASLIEEIGHWPTDDNLRQKRHQDASFPSLSVVAKFRRSGALEREIIVLSQTSGQFSRAAMIAKGRLPPEQETPDLDERDKVRGYVYLLRYGRRYKIGKSTDPSRRYREISLLLPQETIKVHAIPTDDPTGIEKYWNNRFEGKRIRNTEFFELDANDVRAFKRRKYQ